MSEQIPRLILDANVLLNAITAPANTILGRLHTRFRHNEIRVVFSEALLSEFQQILEYPHIQTRFKLGPPMGSVSLEICCCLASTFRPCHVLIGRH
jgi:predicted nucleic acid-binding protein